MVSGPKEPEPLTEYANDFPGFCRNILGVKPWRGQRIIGKLVAKYPRVAVAACYASGKTFIAACLVLWWLYTRRPAMVITTAPTGRQVRNLLWRQIKKLLRTAKKRLPGRSLQVQLEIAPDWWAMGFASNNPTAVQGMHEAENVLFVEDEAAGMDDEVVEGFEGVTASPNSRHLKIGNPTTIAGAFYDCFHSERKRWKCFHISALETPNYRQRRVVVPGLVTYEWVKDKKRKWKRDSPHWQAKVLGRFPSIVGEKVCPAEWIALAQARWAELADGEELAIGVDIARSGEDSSCVALRRGRRVHIIDRPDIRDLMKLAEKVCAWVNTHRVKRVNIDATGLGIGAFDKLKELEAAGQFWSDEVQLNPVGLGKSASEKDTYNRLSDEIQFQLRHLLDPSNPEAIAIAPEEKDLADQLNWRSWELNEAFKIKCESKKALRKRGLSSPDEADAVAMACYLPPRTEINFF